MTTIEQDIREAYKGILSEEQIEATIKWCKNKEEQVFEQGRIAGLAKAEAASIEECFYVARNAIKANIREEENDN